MAKKKEVETITIEKRVYNALIANKEELMALYDYGVDNWKGYDEAISSIDNQLEDK